MYLYLTWVFLIYATLTPVHIKSTKLYFSIPIYFHPQVALQDFTYKTSDEFINDDALLNYPTVCKVIKVAPPPATVKCCPHNADIILSSINNGLNLTGA